MRLRIVSIMLAATVITGCGDSGKDNGTTSTAAAVHTKPAPSAPAAPPARAVRDTGIAVADAVDAYLSAVQGCAASGSSCHDDWQAADSAIGDAIGVVDRFTIAGRCETEAQAAHDVFRNLRNALRGLDRTIEGGGAATDDVEAAVGEVVDEVPTTQVKALMGCAAIGAGDLG